MCEGGWRGGCSEGWSGRRTQCGRDKKRREREGTQRNILTAPLCLRTTKKKKEKKKQGHRRSSARRIQLLERPPSDVCPLLCTRAFTRFVSACGGSPTEPSGRGVRGGCCERRGWVPTGSSISTTTTRVMSHQPACLRHFRWQVGVRACVCVCVSASKSIASCFLVA